VNVPGNDGKKLRARRNYNNLPTLCNDELTQAVLSLVGSGDYEADAGNSRAAWRRYYQHVYYGACACVTSCLWVFSYIHKYSRALEINSIPPGP